MDGLAAGREGQGATPVRAAGQRPVATGGVPLGHGRRARRARVRPAPPGAHVARARRHYPRLPAARRARLREYSTPTCYAVRPRESTG